MFKSVWQSCVLALAVCTTAGIAIAQDQPARAPSSEAGRAYRAKEIIGSKVSLEGNTAVSTVDDIVFDDNGNVDYLIVVREDQKLVSVPWDAADFNVEKRIATVHITPERFEAVPTYTVKQYPTFSAPTYRTEVYRYYGLTPGQQRRLIRRGALPPN